MIEISGRTTRLIPQWVRWLTLAVLVALLLAAIGMLVATALDPQKAAWAGPAATFTETIGTGLFILLAIFFLDRGRSGSEIARLSEQYLLGDIPKALRQIDYDRPRFTYLGARPIQVDPIRSNVEIRVSHAKEAFRADYWIRLEGASLFIKVEMNVRRLGLQLCVPGRRDETAEDVFGAMVDTFAGAASAGYIIGTAMDVTRSRPDLVEMLAAERCFGHSMHRMLSEDFLYDPLERRFVAQDMAVMVRSLVTEGDLKGRRAAATEGLGRTPC